MHLDGAEAAVSRAAGQKNSTHGSCKARVDPAHLLPSGPSDSVWGYYLWDEPYPTQENGTMYTKLKDLQDQVHAQQPAALVYINAGDGSPDLPTFDEAYLDAVEPDLMSFYFYPLFGNSIGGKQLPDTRGTQLKLLEDARRTSLARDIPFWNYFAGAGSPQFVPYGLKPGQFTDITAEQMAWQVWTSLAFGSKGLLYYFYYQPPEKAHCRTFMTYPGMLDTYGRPSHHYYDAQAINSAVVALGPTLVKLRSTNTTFIDDLNGAKPIAPGSDDIHNEPWPALSALPNCPLKNVTGGALVVGCFEFAAHPEDTAVLVMNYEAAFNVWATLDFEPGVMEVSQTTGTDTAVVDAAPLTPGVQVFLRPGAGRLFVSRDSAS